jgi:L-threonine kinase
MEPLASVAVPATCGELVQGTLDGMPCLVSCPIDRYSVAQIEQKSTPGWEVPGDASKAVAAFYAGLAYLGGMRQGGRLRLISDLPRGRGYGSSTADIGAALYALGQALGRPMAPDQVARLAVSVEPSDGTIFHGLALFDHRDASFHERLGPAPPLSVVVIDPGGEVDTLAFNLMDHRESLVRLAAQHREAFGLLREGIRTGNCEAVGQAATLSARVHQDILPNPLLEPILAMAREVGALGVCRAHSGTLLGLLLAPGRADLSAVAAFLAGRLPDSVAVSPHRLLDGGPRYWLDISHPARKNETNLKPTVATR